jgi:hypothetical protein
MPRYLIPLGLIVAIALGMFCGGCRVFGVLSGSGTPMTQTFALQDFNRVSASHTFDVDIRRADTYSVKVTIDDNLADSLEVVREGETLVLRLEPGYQYTSINLKAEITMPRLREVNLSGASRADITGFAADDDLRLELSGASQADLSGLSTAALNFQISGASRVSGEVLAEGNARFNVSGASRLTLNGRVRDIEAEASGASTLELLDFPARDVNVEVSGASTVRVNLDGRLSGSLSGVSRLFYDGDPVQININTSGGSSINRQ